MSENKVLYEKQKEIARIKLNNPPLNTIDMETLKKLDETISMIEGDEEIRVVIVEGEGKAFSAGANLKMFMEANIGKAYEISRYGQKVMQKIRNSQKIYIAKIHGYALGGGLELALTCDITLATKNSRLGSPEATLGLIPGWTATQKLPKIVGEKKAKEIILTGRQLTGEEAEKIGLINMAVEEGELEEKTMEIANKLLGNAPKALTEAKKLINKTFETEFQEGLELEAESFSQLFNTIDLREGLKAFMEKRKPKYQGK